MDSYPAWLCLCHKPSHSNPYYQLGDVLSATTILLNENNSIFPPLDVGIDIVANSDVEDAKVASASYTKLKEIIFCYTGRINLDWKWQNTSTGAFAAYSKLYLNGVAYSIEHSTTQTGANWETDSADYIMVHPGDKLQIYVMSASGYTITAKEFRIYATSPILLGNDISNLI